MAPCMQLAEFEKASSGNEEVLKPLVSGGEWQQFPYFLEGPKYVEWLSSVYDLKHSRIGCPFQEEGKNKREGC